MMPDKTMSSFSDDNLTTSTNAGSTASATSFADLLEFQEKVRAMMPPPNRDQCKLCGKLIGYHFGGLVNIEPIPVRVLPSTPAEAALYPSLLLAGATIACYVCPPCWGRIQEKLGPATTTGSGKLPPPRPQAPDEEMDRKG